MLVKGAVMENGALPIFKSSELSMLDINDLIDKGERFTIGFELTETEYMNISDFLDKSEQIKK